MKRRTFFGLAAASALVVACGAPQPEPVTYLRVEKRNRKLYAYKGDKVWRKFDIDLGFTPVGHKQFEADGKTPEGRYTIWSKNPNSAYHRNLGISYPNAQDRAYAQNFGISPGGDIFIHGGPTRYQDRNKRDWTAGCVSVTDKQIEELFKEVPVGTPIDILA